MIDPALEQEDTKCDITGNKIRMGRPVISIDNSITIKTENGKDAIDFLKKSNGNSYNITVKDSLNIRECDKCRNSRADKKLSTKGKKPSVDTQIYLCEGCYQRILDDIDRIRRDIEENFYYARNGICLFKNHRFKNLKDVVDDKRMNKNKVFAFLSLEGVLFCRIVNISKLSEMMTGEVSNKLKEYSGTENKCCICGKNKHILITNIEVCEGCCQEAGDKIKKFEKENRNFIMSIIL